MARTKLSPEQKAEKEATEKKRLEEANRLSQIRELGERVNAGLIHEPTRHFNVGDLVEYGAWTNSVVKEVLFDGKGYILEVTKIYDGGQYEKPHDPKTEIRIVSWMDAFPKRTQEIVKDIPIMSKRFDFGQAYNTSVDSLIHQYYYFGVDMNPSYQRDHVWTLEDKVDLIDSIMNDVEIGRFVFMKKPYDTNDKTMFEIIDGKQRLTAIIEFYEDRFEYKGKKFSELHPLDQNHFESKMTLKIEPAYMDMETRIEYFIRINTTGKVMDKEHLEKVKNMLVKFKSEPGC